MPKRSRDILPATSQSSPADRQPSYDGEGIGSPGDDDGATLKKTRSFMATLACDVCRSRKTRCDEDKPICGYCKVNSLECKYQTPRATKKDQSMTVAINAIRRLEAKIEDLTTAVNSSQQTTALPQRPTPDHPSPNVIFSPATPSHNANGSSHDHPDWSAYDMAMSPQIVATPGKSPFSVPNMQSKVPLSFSQHRVATWPAIKRTLPHEFVAACTNLPQDYIVETEGNRGPLPIDMKRPYGTSADSWLKSLSQSAVRGLTDAHFAVFHRLSPVLDKYHFYDDTLGTAAKNEFGYDIESCLVLVVLALGCLAVYAHVEGNFSLPSVHSMPRDGFRRPDWYHLTTDNPPGLRFFNEARKRFGFLMCQNDLQAGQFHMLSTLYYSQILRPLDSWTTVNRAALCCTSLLSRSRKIEYDTWEGDRFSRLFWNTLMYETVITQELDLLPHSGLLEYEPDVPLPKFTPCPRPKTSISELVTDEDDAFFNFHFLAQAAHRIILTRVKQNIYYFAEKEGFPSVGITAEMHHQLEQWRANLPAPLQFADDDSADDSPSPAHVIAKAMLRSRYLVAKFHIGRPFLYKALHAPAYTTEAEYNEVREGLRGGMYWPTTMGLCTQMLSALPIKFGWCCQCFGQLLLFHAVARSSDEKLRATLPEGWQDWVNIMMMLIESCARDSPGIAKDAELLRLL